MRERDLFYEVELIEDMLTEHEELKKKFREARNLVLEEAADECHEYSEDMEKGLFHHPGEVCSEMILEMRDDL